MGLHRNSQMLALIFRGTFTLFLIFISLQFVSCGFKAKAVLEEANLESGQGGIDDDPPPGNTGGDSCVLNTVTLAWDGNEPTATGHVIYAGPNSRAYNRTFNFPLVAVTPAYTQTVTGLGMGTQYIAVTAYNGSAESGYSNEVSQNFLTCGEGHVVYLKKLPGGKVVLLSEKEFQLEHSEEYQRIKNELPRLIKRELYRQKLKEDLPPGDLTLNVDGFEKDWEK